MGLKLMAEVGLDGSGFEAGLHRMESLSHGVAEGLKGFAIQAIGVATVEQAISKTVETAKELVDTSRRLSIAPEQLQLLRQAAKESGVELEDVAGFLEKIDIARQKALTRGSEGMNARRDFASLGVNREALHTQSAAQIFMGALAQTAKGRNAEELGALFRDLGIKGFGPMLAVLKTDFDELGSKMKKTGAIMDTETAVKLKLLGEEFSFLGVIIATRLGPLLVRFAEGLIKVVGGLAATWTYLSTFFKGDEGRDRMMSDIMQNTPGFGGLHEGEHPPMPPKEIQEEVNKKNSDRAKEAATETFKKFEGFSKGLEEKFKEMAEQLNHPPKADFSESSLPEKVAKKELINPADAMTKVGNFLGGMGITAQIEARKLELLQQIAHNTAPRAGGGNAPPHSPALSPNHGNFGGGVHFPH